jgi:hypothetical protein
MVGEITELASEDRVEKEEGYQRILGFESLEVKVSGRE